MRLIDNNYHNTISAFIIINISKNIVKSKNAKKSEKFFNAYLKNNPPLSTFIGNNSFIDLSPSINNIGGGLYMARYRSGMQAWGTAGQVIKK